MLSVCRPLSVKCFTAKIRGLLNKVGSRSVLRHLCMALMSKQVVREMMTVCRELFVSCSTAQTGDLNNHSCHRSYVQYSTAKTID